MYDIRKCIWISFHLTREYYVAGNDCKNLLVIRTTYIIGITSIKSVKNNYELKLLQIPFFEIAWTCRSKTAYSLALEFCTTLKNINTKITKIGIAVTVREAENKLEFSMIFTSQKKNFRKKKIKFCRPKNVLVKYEKTKTNKRPPNFQVIPIVGVLALFLFSTVPK